MEIEAKFIIPDKTVFSSLMNIKNIHRFDVQDAVSRKFSDTYMDTADMAVYASGFSFRVREKKDKVVYTLKALKSSDSLLHVREEAELISDRKSDVEDWDDCVLKNRILNMTGSGRLYPCFSVEHVRTDMQITDGQRLIAEMSLDDVIIICESGTKSYLELEIELSEGGTQDDILDIASFFMEETGLVPGSSSKFDNGMELYRENIKNNAQSLGYGDISPAKLSFLPLRDIFEEYNVEREHARKVAENALELFNRLMPVHNMNDKFRETIRFAALVHDIGVMVDMHDHHKAGRDILLKSCPEEMVCPFCVFLPWTTYLHKKKISRKKLQKLSVKNKFSSLPLAMRNDILSMAAILRIADGLDLSRMGSRISDINIEGNPVIIKVHGPGAEVDCDRADSKADLWRLLFKRDIQFREC